ncbi:hypothetical protein KEJ15_01005 [Candidatus Bathyarchaeota archaeon]|nr:hypothetical protein [Candidatus Bathyarchaeota archaeon]
MRKVRRASRIVQTIRDAILVVLSIVFISTSTGPGKESANLIFAGICGVVLTFTIIDIILNALRVQGKGYFRGNAIFQLLLGIFLTIGLYPPLGIVLVAFNAAVLVALYEKKTPEELLKHPPKPITRRYRVFVGAGVLIMFVGILFSWFNNINFPLIGVYLRTVDLTEAASLVSNPMVVLFGFLALVGAPISLILGLLSMFKRLFAWASGVLAVVTGIGWIVTMTTMAGLGAFVFTFAGVIVLAGSIIDR